MELQGKTVQLQGRSDDLKCLSRWGVGDARAYKYAEDGYYYLKDPTFDETTDDREIPSKAEIILKALNEYAKARCDEFQPVELGPVCTFEEGERKITNFIAPVAGSSEKIDSGKSLQDAHADVKKILEGQKQDRTMRKIQQKKDRSVQKIFFTLSTIEAIIFFILGNALSTFGFSLQNIMIVAAIIVIIVVASFILITRKY